MSKSLTKKIVFILFVTFFLLPLSQLAYSETSPESPSPKIPPNSLFSKISINMSRRQVTDLIGHPTETESFKTPKSYNPFYFGRDRHHTLFHYKGNGLLEFDRDQILVDIIYDPNENGYRKR